MHRRPRAGGGRQNSFGPREMAQAESSADQALIAIKSRLFREAQEALERQTTTSEVPKVIASSPSMCSQCSTRLRRAPLFARRVLDHRDPLRWRCVHLVAFTRTNAEQKTPCRPYSPGQLPIFRPSCWFGRRDAAFVDAEAESDVPRVDQGTGAIAWLPQHAVHAADDQRRAIGMISVTRRVPAAFVADDARLLADLRRSGGDCDPERAAL